MTTPDQILVDLLSGQSTADSIAGRLHVPTLVVEAMLHRHTKDGLTSSGTIGNALTVWKLTRDGHAAAAELKPSRRPRTTAPQPATPA
jgi:hypothetical protein